LNLRPSYMVFSANSDRGIPDWLNGGDIGENPVPGCPS
jgi:hypothetical protein